MSQAGILRGATGGGGGGTGILSITGNTGGQVGADGANNINVVGSGAIIVDGFPGTNTLIISSSNPFFLWSVITANQPAVSQMGYFTNGGSRVDLSLPVPSFVGDVFVVADLGGNGWRITQGGSQQILIGDSSTTVGAAGSLASIFIGDSITLVCCVDDTTWMAVPAPTGNLTII